MSGGVGCGDVNFFNFWGDSSLAPKLLDGIIVALCSYVTQPRPPGYACLACRRAICGGAIAEVRIETKEAIAGTGAVGSVPVGLACCPWPANPTYCEDPAMANVDGGWRAISLFLAPPAARWHRSTVQEFEARVVSAPGLMGGVHEQLVAGESAASGSQGVKVARRPARTFPPAHSYRPRLALEWI